MRRLVSRRVLALLVLLSTTLLSGCGWLLPHSQVRGNKVDTDALKELVPGTATRADAQSLLGSPTTKASFDDNTWIYIGEVTRPVIASTQTVLTQEVVVLTFDQAGVLRSVKTLSGKDALPVSVIARATPSPGSNASFMQQLLGNVGRFNAGPAGTPGNAAGGGGPGGGGGGLQ